jgi:hypothetical protein
MKDQQQLNVTVPLTKENRAFARTPILYRPTALTKII